MVDFYQTNIILGKIIGIMAHRGNERSNIKMQIGQSWALVMEPSDACGRSGCVFIMCFLMHNWISNGT